MRVAIVCVLAAVGCASSNGTSPDAARDGHTSDTPGGGGACDPTASFGVPLALTELNGGPINSQAALSPDELTAYFTSNRIGPGMKVFTAARSSPTAAFGTPAELTSLDFAGADTWNVTLTGDGLTAYYVTDQGGGDNLYKAQRTSSLTAFTSAGVMPNPIVEGEQPFVVANGSALYYSDYKLGPKGKIVRATLGGTPVATLQTSLDVAPHDVGIPVVTPDELTMFFAVFDMATFSSYDIWMSTRASTNDAWSKPHPVNELDTAVFEAPSWVSPDGCELYFTRAPDAAHWSIYVARRP